MQTVQSIMERIFGLNWRTSAGQTLAAAGGVLATQTTGNWRIAGGVMLAVGLAWAGVNTRDANVTSAQMKGAADAKQEGSKP